MIEMIDLSAGDLMVLGSAIRALLPAKIDRTTFERGESSVHSMLVQQVLNTHTLGPASNNVDFYVEVNHPDLLARPKSVGLSDLPRFGSEGRIFNAAVATWTPSGASEVAHWISSVYSDLHGAILRDKKGLTWTVVYALLAVSGDSNLAVVVIQRSDIGSLYTYATTEANVTETVEREDRQLATVKR